jgi:FtsH-binding integral membrane protein
MKIQSQHLIYLVLPGLVLFLVDQSMFIGLRGRMLPAAAAVAYCVVFAVIATGGLALNFVVRRANPDLAVQRLAFIASMVLAIGCLANLASTGGQLSSRQLLYFAAIGLALAIGILATKRLLGFSSRALAAMALLAVAVLWAMAFPERDGLVEPYSYL